MNSECTLATLPGSTDEDRILVVMVQTADGTSHISMRHQNWADGIGWYDQKSLDLEPEQFRMLRNLCGPASRSRSQPRAEAVTLLFPGVTCVESA
ncbi:MAG: hypothetical protein K2R98_14690 [Gemmataceae bacterium]|nr:hypothetical protein [Gemmataceae bacterium]